MTAEEKINNITPEEEINNPTPEEKIMFQKGFKVAVNFLFHHHLDAGGNDDEVAQQNFREFLHSTTDTNQEKEIIEEAIALRTTMPGEVNCGAGFCSIGGQCVRCKFEFAFDGTFHS